MGRVDFIVRFLEGVAKIFGPRALTAFFLGVAVMVPVGGIGVYVIANLLNQTRVSSMQERWDITVSL
jgi:hypothetical protein